LLPDLDFFRLVFSSVPEKKKFFSDASTLFGISTYFYLHSCFKILIVSVS